MLHDHRRLAPTSLLLVALLATAGLAGPAAEKEEESEGGDLVEFRKEHPLAEPLPDKALVYVVRPTSVGFAIKSFFFCDDEILGINRGSSYFFAHVPAGKRVFWSKSENVDALELEVEAGKTYYIQQHVRMGGLRARTKLEVLERADGEERLSKCKKHGTLTEQGRARGAEMARQYRGETLEDLDRRSRESEPRAEEKED